MVENPYSPPLAHLFRQDRFDISKVRKVAKWQKLLLLSIVIGFPALILPNFMVLTTTVRIVFFLANSFFQLWCVVSLCGALSMKEVSSWAYFVIMFIPIANLIALLILNNKATTFIRSAGFHVGIFGAKIP